MDFKIKSVSGGFLLKLDNIVALGFGLTGHRSNWVARLA